VDFTLNGNTYFLLGLFGVIFYKIYLKFLSVLTFLWNYRMITLLMLLIIQSIIIHISNHNCLIIILTWIKLSFKCLITFFISKLMLRSNSQLNKTCVMKKKYYTPVYHSSIVGFFLSINFVTNGTRAFCTLGIKLLYLLSFDSLNSIKIIVRTTKKNCSNHRFSLQYKKNSNKIT
jgi:hypothetical protein